MAIKYYKHGDKTQLSPHFNVSEFQCKCGGAHETPIDENLVTMLEKLYDALDCSAIIISSGYRCIQHDKAVGGNGGGYHTKGQAADICCYAKNGAVISSKIVCCTAQDLGFGGIANIYEDLNLIVVHLGGGTSVSAHCKGRVIDTNNALNGDGPFSPERSGALPAQQLADICFSGKYTAQEVKKMINGRGGTVAHLGTNDFMEIERKMVDDPHFKLIADAYLYNIAKEIGAMAAVLKGKVNAILVTGGIAYGKGMMADLAAYVDWIAPVKIYPGEDEMGALAHNGLSVMQGREVAKVY